jgi:hypothetical protein
MNNDFYIRQIRTRLDIGLYVESMSTNLQQLHDRKEISDAEYAELQEKISELLRKKEQSQKQVADEQKTDIIVEEDAYQAPLDKKQNLKKEIKEENPPAEEKDKDTPKPKEEFAPKEEPVVENLPKAQWVADYRTVLYQWSASHAERKIKSFEAQENSFKATFSDNVVLNFKSPRNAVIKPSNPDHPKAEDFDTLIAVAKSNNKKIKLSDNMSEEFRNALIEACAKANVTISNLSEEGKALYDSFSQKPKELQPSSSEERSPEEIKRQQQIDEIRKNIQKSMGKSFISASDEDILNAMSAYVMDNINKLPPVLDSKGLKDLQQGLISERDKQIAIRDRYNTTRTQADSK